MRPSTDEDHDEARALETIAAAGNAGVTVASVSEADARTRTGDPFITSEVLYQLSYVGVSSQLSARNESPTLTRPPSSTLA